MNELTINIWQRQLSLPIEYDVYPGESITPLQKKAVEVFIREADINSAKMVIEYCIHKDGNHTGERIDNIFRYVMPRYIYVPNTTKERVVAIMCDYRFDEEHGLAIVYENEVLKEIGPEDTVL